jgi:hypothetical protein
MKDLVELQKKHDNEMRCAVWENKMNEEYEKQGFIFVTHGMYDDGKIMTSIYRLPQGSGVYLSLSETAKILREIPKTAGVYDISVLSDATQIKWEHGVMRIIIYIKNSEIRLEEQGTIYDIERANEIIKNITRNTRD